MIDQLGDCHVHLLMDGKNYKEAVALHKNGVQDGVIRERLQAYAQAGITFLRDGGDFPGVSKRAKELAEDYGITYLTPVYAIYRKGHYGGIVGRSFADLKEYHALVKNVSKSGGDFVKLMLSGLIDFSEYGKLSEEGLLAEWITEMIRIAHEEGMAVMAHCNGARQMQAAACSGVDSIEHGAYADAEALQAMAEHQVLWTPTISPIANLRGSGRFPDEVVEEILQAHLENVRQFVSLGGHIAPGSDAGAWRVPHVEGSLCECSYLKELVDEAHLLETQNRIKRKFRKQ